MRAKWISVTGAVGLALAVALLAGGQSGAQGAEMKLQAFLLWGTDDSKPPEGKTYKPAQLDIREKLKDLPLKWTNWFEVRHKDFTVLQGAAAHVPVSEKCELNVTRGTGSEVEVCLIGRGKEVVRRKQSLPGGEMLVLGGNAPNATAWLVVLKRLD